MDWEKRPIEIKTLLNPAFCGEILVECIKTFESRKGPFPFPLVFLTLPILLHPRTRSTIPYSSKYMHLWIHNHKEILIGFADRLKNLIPITMETISFLLQCNVLELDDKGNLILNKNVKLKTRKERHQDVMDCINKAHHLGKLFASAGNMTTIFNMWGVCP